MIKVGLDFGTSNSSIARAAGDKIELYPLDPGSINPRMLRSFLFIDRAHHAFTGSEAVRQYQEKETGRPVYWENRSMGQVKMVVGGAGSSPIVYWDDMMVQIDTNAQGRLIQSIKTALRTQKYEGTEIFERFYSVEALIAILLGQLKEKCEATTGEEIGHVVLGRPVKFSDNEEIDRHAQAKIEAAARLAGFTSVSFEMEPIAAAYVYHQQASEQQAALIFDFGGGTLDLTVVELGGAAPKVLATQGVLLGGDDLDKALMQPLKKHFGEGATLRNRRPLPAHLMDLLDSWQTMVMLSRPEYNQILRDARRGNNPSAVKRLDALVNRNLGFALYQEIEQAKIKLSDAATAMIQLESEDFRVSELVTRPQFERLIANDVANVEREIDEALLKSGLHADQIQAVIRTGGSSEIPAFIRMLGNKFGHDRLRPLNPFETIVGGLAIKAGEYS